jgi:hypothetical protein
VYGIGGQAGKLCQPRARKIGIALGRGGLHRYLGDTELGASKLDLAVNTLADAIGDDLLRLLGCLLLLGKKFK